MEDLLERTGDALPTGVVTFLFTDIEGSTPLWERDREAMQASLAKHNAILYAAIRENSGQVFKIIGDAFQAAFPLPIQAVTAAVAAQRALAAESWGSTGLLRVRMALHSAPGELQAGDYAVSHDLNRVARIMAAGHGGQILLSQAVAELVRRELGEDVRLKDMGQHLLKGMAYPERLYQLVATGLPADFPALVTQSVPRHNLPAQLTQFIGRKREIAEVKGLLSAHRLLTLTGPGGGGKTRLALQVASETTEDYRDGIWLTEFASLPEEQLVPQAVASTLGVREQVGRQVSESLAAYLHARTALLVLDNCEHLVGACAQLSSTLLASCPHIRLLATSREPLGVPGEAVWMVPPLSLPAPQHVTSSDNEAELLDAYQQSEAIQLFVARATMTSPSFRLTPQNGPWVADICRRLDGIPLAVELAAARVHVFSARQIADRLDDRFQLLTSRLRTVPRRHQTLQATLEWSYALLSDVEQKVLQRLSVFAGWRLAAAEAVCGGGVVRVEEVTDVVSNLVDKSLVVVVDSFQGRRRYRLLETILQYAQQKLSEAGDTDAVRDRHLNYFLQWAQAAATHLAGPEQARWLEQFEAEHDNLRAALDWSQTSESRTGQGLGLAAACGNFWTLHGYFREGRERLAATLGQVGARERTLERSDALLWAAHLAHMQSDYSAERSLAKEALDISRELGSAGRLAVAAALDSLGKAAVEVGEYETSLVFFEEALTLYRQLNEKAGVAGVLMELGWAAMRAGDYERADALFTESLPLFRELAESFMLGFVLAGLGELAVRKGQLDRATDLLEESLALRRELGDRRGISATLGSLGWVALLRGDFNRMRALLQESLAIRREFGVLGGIAWNLEKLAQATTLQARSLASPHRLEALSRAVCVFGAAAALRASVGSVIDRADQPEHERILAELLGALGEPAFHAAWEKGSGMPLLEIIDLALVPVV